MIYNLVIYIICPPFVHTMNILLCYSILHATTAKLHFNSFIDSTVIWKHEISVALHKSFVSPLTNNPL